jgi:hypothetical protein
MSMQLPSQGKKVFYTFYSVMSIVDKYVYDIRFVIFFLLVMLIIATQNQNQKKVYVLHTLLILNPKQP